MLEHLGLMLSVPKPAEEDKTDLKKPNKHLKTKTTMTEHDKLNYF